LYEVFEAIFNHELDKVNINIKSGSCACVIMASGGYPESYPKGIEMFGFNDMGQIDGCFVYHAGTKLSDDGKFLTNGGRVIGVTAAADTLQAALDKAYEGVNKITFDKAHYRKDIGQKALNALK
jgi:phosphoribosylamine--glycine ligase